MFLFGTNGFLVFHALLLGLDLFVAYAFLAGRGGARPAALVYATVFLAASVVPVYFVWLTPELFNFSLTLYALFLWSYKEVAADRPAARWRAFLRGSGSDYAGGGARRHPDVFQADPRAAHVSRCRAGARPAPVAARVADGRRAGGCVAGACSSANAAITGEFNYQGGDRKTFYSSIGFPFANDRETFENIGPVRGREGVLLGDILVNRAYADGVPPQPGLFRGRPFQRVGAVLFSGRRERAAVSRLESAAAAGNGSSARRSSARPSRCCW